ncbi:starch-binding domain-containing protein 1 [Protopterus annectens]|uniref:starch-binding domain-containing protein 1 n=1 Tax=Protopterus annectens TaxID=7888 RepID=UPI001CF9B5CB|nr:starch-binding domain-containing protein 1 [Protopterus annectens]
MFEGFWSVLLMGFITAFCGWVWLSRQQRSKSSQSKVKAEEKTGGVGEDLLYPSTNIVAEESMKKLEELKQKSYDFLAPENGIIQESKSSCLLHDFAWTNVPSEQKQTVSSHSPMGGSTTSRDSECYPGTIPCGDVATAFILPTRLLVPESEKVDVYMHVNEYFMLPKRRESGPVAKRPFVQGSDMVVSEEPMTQCRHPEREYVQAVVSNDQLETVESAKSEQDFKHNLIRNGNGEDTLKEAVEQLNAKVKVLVQEESKENAAQLQAIGNCKGAVGVLSTISSERKDQEQQFIKVCKDVDEMAEELAVSQCISSLREESEQKSMANIRPHLEDDTQIWGGIPQAKRTESVLETTVEQMHVAPRGVPEAYKFKAETAELSTLTPHRLGVAVQKFELCKIIAEKVVVQLNVDYGQEQKTSKSLSEKVGILLNEVPPNVNLQPKSSGICWNTAERNEHAAELSVQLNTKCDQVAAAYLKDAAKRVEQITVECEQLQKKDTSEKVTWATECEEYYVQQEIAENCEGPERMKQIPEYVAESVKWTTTEYVQGQQVACVVPKASDIPESTAGTVEYVLEFSPGKSAEESAIEFWDASEREKSVVTNWELGQETEMTKGTAETMTWINWCERSEESKLVCQAIDEKLELDSLFHSHEERDLCQDIVHDEAVEVCEDSAKSVEQFTSECELPQEEMKREAVETPWVTANVEKDEIIMETRMECQATAGKLSQIQGLVHQVATVASEVTAESMEQVAEILDGDVRVDNIVDILVDTVEGRGWVTAACELHPKEAFVKEAASVSKDATKTVEQVNTECDLTHASVQHVAVELVAEPTAGIVELITTQCKLFHGQDFEQHVNTNLYGTDKQVKSVTTEYKPFQEEENADVETFKDIEETVKDVAKILDTAEKAEKLTIENCPSQKLDFVHLAIAELHEDVTERLELVTTKCKPPRKDDYSQLQLLLLVAQRVNNGTVECELNLNKGSLQCSVVDHYDHTESVEKGAEVPDHTNDKVELELKKDTVQHVSRQITENIAERLEEVVYLCEMQQEEGSVQQVVAVVSEDAVQSVVKVTTESEQFQQLDYTQHIDTEFSDRVEETNECELFQKRDSAQQKVTLVSEDRLEIMEDLTTECKTCQENDSQQATAVISEYASEEVTKYESLHQEDLLQYDTAVILECSTKVEETTTECELSQEKSVQPEMSECEVSQKSFVQCAVVENIESTSEGVGKLATECKLHEDIQQTTELSRHPAEGVEKVASVATAERTKWLTECALPQKPDPASQKTAVLSKEMVARLEQVTTECKQLQDGTVNTCSNAVHSSDVIPYKLPRGKDFEQNEDAAITEVSAGRMEQFLECESPQMLEKSVRQTTEISKDTPERIEMIAEMIEGTAERKLVTIEFELPEKVDFEREKLVTDMVKVNLVTECLFHMQQEDIDIAEGVDKELSTESKLSSSDVLVPQPTTFESIEQSTNKCKLPIKDAIQEGARRNDVHNSTAARDVDGGLVQQLSSEKLPHVDDLLQQGDAAVLDCTSHIREKELPVCNLLGSITSVIKQFNAECSVSVNDPVQELIKENVVIQADMSEKSGHFTIACKTYQNESAEEQLSNAYRPCREETVHYSMTCGKAEHLPGKHWLAKKWDLKNEILGIKDVDENVLHKYSTEKLTKNHKELHDKIKKKENYRLSELDLTNLESEEEKSAKKASEPCRKISANCVFEDLENKLQSQTSEYTPTGKVAFKSVNKINKENKRTLIAPTYPMPQNVLVNFRVHYITHTDSQQIAVTGSHDILGKWEKCISLKIDKDGFWSGNVLLPVDTRVEWKFVMVDSGKFSHWEECNNRFLETGFEDQEVHRCWGFH